jgi:hypothetical protein
LKEICEAVKVYNKASLKVRFKYPAGFWFLCKDEAKSFNRKKIKNQTCSTASTHSVDTALDLNSEMISNFSPISSGDPSTGRREKKERGFSSEK